MASLPTVDGAHYATLEQGDRHQLTNVSAVNPPADAPSNVEFPYGMFEFTVTGVPNGGTVTMRLFIPRDTRITAYYKKNMNTGQWDNIATSIEHGPAYAPNKTVVTFQLTDGGAYDEDGASDGSILDQGGPRYEESGVVEPINVPTLNTPGVLFFALLTALAGFYALRKRAV